MQRRTCVKKNLDMTEGKPISLLWAFTFPTLMGNLLNQVYSITDSIVVGISVRPPLRRWAAPCL